MKLKLVKLMDLFEGEIEAIDKTGDCCESIYIGSEIRDIPCEYDDYVITKVFVGALSVLIIWLEKK